MPLAAPTRSKNRGVSPRRRPRSDGSPRAPRPQPPASNTPLRRFGRYSLCAWLIEVSPQVLRYTSIPLVGARPDPREPVLHHWPGIAPDDPASADPSHRLADAVGGCRHSRRSPRRRARW
jgi:hypothetical protein